MRFHDRVSKRARHFSGGWIPRNDARALGTLETYFDVREGISAVPTGRAFLAVAHPALKRRATIRRPLRDVLPQTRSSTCLALTNLRGTTDSASVETELFPARAPARRSSPRRVQFPCRSRRAARCRICAGQGTT